MTVLRYWTIATGNAGVRQTVEMMLRMMRSPSPAIREQAERIIYDANIRAHPFFRTVQREVPYLIPSAIYTWVQRHMTYTPDASHPVETDHGPDLLDEELRSPDYLLGQIAEHGTAFGDCDDYVILMGALLLSVGIPMQVVLVSSAPSGVYDHVYLQLDDGTALDAITGEPFGWFVPSSHVTAKEVIDV